MAHALFVVYEAAHAELALSIAAMVAAYPTFRLTIWSPYYLPLTETYRQRAAALGSGFVHATTALGGLVDLAHSFGVESASPRSPPCSKVASSDALDRFWTEARQQSPENTAMLSSCVESAIIATEKDIIKRARILDGLGVSIVLFAEDNSERDSAHWLAAAHEKEIQCVVLCCEAPNSIVAEQTYNHSAAHQVPASFVNFVARHFPKWLRSGEGYAITGLPLATCLAHEQQGIASANPWLSNFGAIDVLAVESRRVADAYVGHGFPEAKIQVVGLPSFDDLARALSTRSATRGSLLRERGLPPTTPIIVTAIPPNQYPQRAAAEFGDYAELLASWLSALENTGALVLASLHPTLKGREHEYPLVNRFVRHEPISALLPLADLFVASVSTTIKWALACGIPTINFDCYQYGYPDYVNCAGVVEARSLEEMQLYLTALLKDGGLADVARDARLNAASWGELDGHCVDRVKSLLGIADAQH